MQPHLFLEAARRLAAGSAPEDIRSAVSRAYYAVYNVAELMMERMAFHKQRTDFHGCLQRRLMASGDGEFQQLGVLLSQLHSDRIRADYQMDHRPSEAPAQAQAAVAKAEKMIEIIQSCPINSQRWKDIQAAIAAYIARAERPTKPPSA